MDARMRLDMRPGLPRPSPGVFPSRSASRTVAMTVASAVASPRITSTSGISGTGLKKCMPITWDGREGAEAVFVVGGGKTQRGDREDEPLEHLGLFVLAELSPPHPLGQACRNTLSGPLQDGLFQVVQEDL